MSLSDDDRIPTDGEYRGVPLHADQSDERLAVVHRDIDAVHLLAGVEALVAFADDAGNAPEARRFARAKALSSLDDVIERRGPRTRASAFSRERIKASAAGADSLTWQCRTHFCSVLDPGGRRRAVRRETPLPEKVYNRIPRADR